MPPREFQIVIYLAGSSETAAGPGLAYANRYFIPVCGNKDRGWGIRWFSRGKFSVGHSDSPSGAFLVCLSFFFLHPSFTSASCDRNRLRRRCTFLRSRFIFPDNSFSCAPPSIWQRRSVRFRNWYLYRKRIQFRKLLYSQNFTHIYN